MKHSEKGDGETVFCNRLWWISKLGKRFVCVLWQICKYLYSWMADWHLCLSVHEYLGLVYFKVVYLLKGKAFKAAHFFFPLRFNLMHVFIIFLFVN